MQFKITKLERNSFSVKDQPDDHADDALYSWFVSDGHCTTGSGSRFNELKPLLAFHGISHLSEMEGVEIDIPDELKPNNDNALELAVLIARNGGHYEQGDPAEIKNLIFCAIAEGRAPNLNDVSKDEIWKAATEIFGSGFQMEDEKFQSLCLEISKISSGKFALQRTSPDVFKSRVKGPGEYLLLKGTTCETERKVFFGPYSTPIFIEE